MERETLTEWPTSPLQDAVEWWLYVTAPHDDQIPGRFRYDDHGRVVFECEDGTALGASTFEEGERFEPIEATGDATITFPPPPEPTYFGDVIPNGRARIASLEAEVSSLRERLTLGESAVTVIANDLGNIRQSLGARDGESTVDAAARVGAELSSLRAQLAAPLRLGRGPTVGELERHGLGNPWLVKQPGGPWVLRLGRTIMHAIPSYTDGIALDPEHKQPCGVGEGKS